MARGGARPGAGRPKGAATKRTRAIADQAAAEGLMPLDVMLRAMRDHAEAQRWDEAAKVAAMAAPYLHPRLAAVDVTTRTKASPADFSDAELLAIVKAGPGEARADGSAAAWVDPTTTLKQ